MTDKVVKTDAEWKAQLSPESYQVARKHGTERAFSGEYHDSKAKGRYDCICCGQPLFSSDTKFDSGTGWPSYWAPIDEDAVTEKKDRSFFMVRTEVLCSKCVGLRIHESANEIRLCSEERSPPHVRARAVTGGRVLDLLEGEPRAVPELLRRVDEEEGTAVIAGLDIRKQLVNNGA